MAHTHFQLWKLHLSSEHTTAVELKGSIIYRNLKTLETIQRILLANTTKTSMHLFFLSPKLNTSHRLLAQSQRSLQSPSLFQVCSQRQRNTLFQQTWTSILNARRLHSSTYTCIPMAQFRFDTWLLNPFLFSLIRKIPTAEGLQRVAWSHQTHMLPMEELFRSAHRGKSTSRKQDARWLFFFWLNFDNQKLQK